MAPLILQSARSARAESRRLRSDLAGLRLTLRSNAQVAAARMATATEVVAVARARRSIPVASPWSGLHWLLEHDSLERILLPLD